jgi:hypothetical protein
LQDGYYRLGLGRHFSEIISIDIAKSGYIAKAGPPWAIIAHKFDETILQSRVSPLLDL